MSRKAFGEVSCSRERAVNAALPNDLRDIRYVKVTFLRGKCQAAKTRTLPTGNVNDDKNPASTSLVFENRAMC